MDCKADIGSRHLVEEDRWVTYRRRLLPAQSRRAADRRIIPFIGKNALGHVHYCFSRLSRPKSLCQYSRTATQDSYGQLKTAPGRNVIRGLANPCFSSARSIGAWLSRECGWISCTAASLFRWKRMGWKTDRRQGRGPPGGRGDPRPDLQR